MLVEGNWFVADPQGLPDGEWSCMKNGHPDSGR